MQDLNSLQASISLSKTCPTGDCGRLDVEPWLDEVLPAREGGRRLPVLGFCPVAAVPPFVGD